MNLSKKQLWTIMLFVMAIGLGLIFAATRGDAPSKDHSTATVRAEVSDSLSSAYGEKVTVDPKTAEDGHLPENGQEKQALTEEPPKVKSLKGAYLAIVVDDLGFSYARAEELAGLKIPLTWAIIPFQRSSKATAELARKKGIPFLVHVPMQAFGDKGSEGQLVALSMDDEKIRRNVREALESLPGAIGVNNHRGSAATSDMRAMRALMEELRQDNMIFLDSRTAASSVAAIEARKAGIFALENGAFIDHLEDIKFMWSQLERAAGQAQRRGYAVAICHARPVTLTFLNQLDSNSDIGAKLVTVDELVRILSKSHGN